MGLFGNKKREMKKGNDTLKDLLIDKIANILSESRNMQANQKLNDLRKELESQGSSEDKKAFEAKISTYNVFMDSCRVQYEDVKEQLSKVLAFIDLNKQKRFSDGVTVMPIATTNKRLLSIWGSSMNISRAIQFMTEIGLLSEYDTTYQFNAYYDKNNKSKLYAYSYDTEQSIITYCNNNNINKYKIINITIVNIFAVEDIPFEKDEVRFSITSDKVVFIESSDNYCIIKYLNNDKISDFVLRSSLKRLANELSETPIQRCHRSYMINLEHVASLKKDNSDISFEFDVPNVKEIPISKSYNEKIMELFVTYSKQK